MTWAQIKHDVAEVVGLQDDPAGLAKAGRAAWAAIGEWNTRHPFRFLEKADSDQLLIASDNTYPLPSDFLELYGVPRLEGSINRPLFPWPRYDRDRKQYRENTGWSGEPLWFDLFQSGTSGEIVLIPFPASVGTTYLKIRYFRPISEPVNDQATLDLPRRWIWGVIARASAIMCSKHNAEDRARMQYFDREAERLFRYARAQDLRRADEVPRFRTRDEVFAAAANDQRYTHDYPYDW